MARTNQEIAQAFANQFNPPLTVVHTERVNDIPINDAWAVSYWDDDKRMGLTAIISNRQIKAYMEGQGPGDMAEAMGQVFADALDMQP